MPLSPVYPPFHFGHGPSTLSGTSPPGRAIHRLPRGVKRVWHPTRGGFALPNPYNSHRETDGRLKRVSLDNDNDTLPRLPSVSLQARTLPPRRAIHRLPQGVKRVWHPTRGGFALPNPYNSHRETDGRLKRGSLWRKGKDTLPRCTDPPSMYRLDRRVTLVRRHR